MTESETEMNARFIEDKHLFVRSLVTDMSSETRTKLFWKLHLDLPIFEGEEAIFMFNHL